MIGNMRKNKQYYLVVVLTSGARLEFSTDGQAIHKEMLSALMQRDAWIEFPPQGDKKHRIHTSQIAEIIEREEDVA